MEGVLFVVSLAGIVVQKDFNHVAVAVARAGGGARRRARGKALVNVRDRRNIVSARVCVCVWCGRLIDRELEFGFCSVLREH